MGARGAGTTTRGLRMTTVETTKAERKPDDESGELDAHASSNLEARTKCVGRELFERMGGGPQPWRREWWEGRFIAHTLRDPLVQVQLFRFIDALPALKTAESVRRHLAEYLAEACARAPWWLRTAVRACPPNTERAGWLAASARTAAGLMAGRFIAGADAEQAARTVLALRKRRLAFTADLLGEAVISEPEAETYQQTCMTLIKALAKPLAQAPEIPLIDRDQNGPIPRMNMSLKLSSLTSHFEPIHAQASLERVAARLRPILALARSTGAYIHVDMEQYSYRALTYDLFCRVLMEPDFRDWPDVGIVVQAYQPEAEAELERLLEFVRERGTPITIRLVKGAYWDYEVSTARRLGWPVPVHVEKWRSDASYERCSRFLVEHHDHLRPAFGSHNVRSLAHAIAAAEEAGLPPAAYELQTLHGMGDAIQAALVDRGHRVRVYTPYGAILPGMAYLVRRLLENTSNDSFLKASFTSRGSIDLLLQNPEETGMIRAAARRLKAQSTDAPPTDPSAIGRFQNEPPTDFARAENRAAMERALEMVRGWFGRTYRPWIAGREVEGDLDLLDSFDPSQSSRVVGRVFLGGREHAEQAVAAARSAFRAWSETPAGTRAEVLFKAAAIMRRDRFVLAAWEVYECGKPWAEADGDVAEAIDFCEFYAREMLRLAEPERRDAPGETNVISHIPRGVAVVIPPWNFPLAIPCGMTVSALVSGCTVILKPAEQAPIIAWKLAQILIQAGAPPGVLNFLPGVGEVVGQALVNHADVDVISFTGSRDVGLLINRQAAQLAPGQNHVKRVIAEMGGKNAILIDDDADLDEAVVGVLASAFGYAGQKCSACSRVIVHEEVHDAFLARLAEAARALQVGPAANPATMVGPVIDADARRRVMDYQALAAAEGRIVFQAELGALADQGYFVGPTIVADVDPAARVAQEEIFGPILAVLKARDLDHALAIADATPYALTGGFYSRSPANIERVTREYRVGNLYINRGITGALVDRQPFGGFKLSGLGSKAGGQDYLREFLLARSVAENTMRRGFAPEPDA